MIRDRIIGYVNGNLNKATKSSIILSFFVYSWSALRVFLFFVFYFFESLCYKISI